MGGTLKILCLADGFGDSEACPDWYPDYYKWPRILSLMLRGVEIVDLCRYGAGNEYLTWCLKQHCPAADMTLIQWAQPNRLDLLLGHNDAIKQQWLDKIHLDQVYNNNIVSVANDQWWISSASTTDWVKEYHNKTISLRQHQIRSIMWIEYAHQLLGQTPHGFMLTPDSEYLQDADVDANVWLWHQPWKGMCSWRHHSRYKELDLGLVQPIPLIHFDFIVQFIMPKFDLPWRNDREINAVESMLLRKYNSSKHNQPS